MTKNDDSNKDKKFRITTPKGNVEINWPNDKRPGFCPYCHKCIPFSSIVFKKECEDGTEVYSGLEAIMEKKEAIIKRKFGISKEKNAGYAEHIGECPYCHRPIPVREIIFKK